MENSIQPPSGSSENTLFSMTSRKRKTSGTDVPRLASEFELPCKSTMKEFGSFSGENGQGNGVSLNQTMSLGPETLRHQFQSNQFHKHNDFQESRSDSGPLSIVPQSSLTIQRLHNNNAEISQLRPVPEDQMRSRDTDCIFPDALPLGTCNVSTDFVRAGGMLPQSSLPDGSCDDYRTKACYNGANEIDHSFQLRQSGQFPNNAGTIKFSYEQMDSRGASSFAEEVAKQSSLQRNIKGIGSSIIPLDGNPESRAAHGVSDLKLNESKEASKMLEASVIAKGLSEHDNKVGDGVEHRHTNKVNQDFDKQNRKSISPGITSSIAAEKLWEGSLQLNSSITVSAVAYFKSGEKLLDINWSETVEVKGKVRLEAFEKYIQDLPRSRSRGLMVISVCWKEGSSKSGLKGMKEVAKGYRKGERVGLARLSPGVDVYLCPRSNTIITILAKHGFFKGKAAVEDNSELWIGCVVWKKNQTTASTAKRSEDKGKSSEKQLPKSPSDITSNQQTGEKSSSFVPAIQNSKSLALVESSSVVENVSVTESKNIPTSDPISRGNLLPNPSVANVSSNSVEQQKSSYPTLPVERQFMEIGAASEGEIPKASVELPKGIICDPLNVMKERIRRSDIDDLPEFDFGNVVETSLTSVSKPLDASAINMKFQLEGKKGSDVMMPPMMPAIHSVSVSDTMSSHSSVHQLSSSFNQEMAVCKSIADREKPILVRQNNEGSHNLQTISTDPVAVVARTYASTRNMFDKFGQKNLFDDEDDMPEWIPPGQEKPSSAEVKEPSRSILSDSSSQSLPVGVSGQPHPSPFPAASLPERSSQAFQPFYPPPPSVKKIPPPLPSEHGSRSLTGFTFTPQLRPPSSSPAIPRPMLPGNKWRSRP